MQSRSASQLKDACMCPGCLPAVTQQYLGAPHHLSALYPHLSSTWFSWKEKEAVFFSYWLLSIDNIWLKTVRQSAQSGCTLSSNSIQCFMWSFYERSSLGTAQRHSPSSSHPTANASPVWSAWMDFHLYKRRGEIICIFLCPSICG